MTASALFIGLKLATKDPARMVDIWSRHMLANFGSVTRPDNLSAALKCPDNFSIQFERLENILLVPGSKVVIYRTDPLSAAFGLTQELMVNGGDMNLLTQPLPINELCISYPKSLSLQTIHLSPPPNGESKIPRIARVEVPLGHHASTAIMQTLVQLGWRTKNDYLVNADDSQAIRFSSISRADAQVTDYPSVSLQFDVFGENVRTVAYGIADKVMQNASIHLEVTNYPAKTVIYGHSMGGTEVVLWQR